MNKRPPKTWVVRLAIVAGVLLVLAVGGLLGWRAFIGWMQGTYYRTTYQPLELAAEAMGDYPVAHHLDDVPWIATREWYCQANSLAMVAGQQGLDTSTGECNLLMGFTYGAVEVPGSGWVNPYTDPESGFAVAAPYLGLVRRYYVTDDPALYRRALRYYLSQGYAVRLALDVAVLYDLEGQFPHSELLVGYDETGFLYYETVCLPEFHCQPRQSPPGEQGMWISEDVLLQAVLRQAEAFSYPWRYSLTLFEPGPRQDDLRPIWARNGQSLIGGAQYGPRQGADAVDKLAATVEKGGTRLDVSGVRLGLEPAAFTRRGNAAYLRSAFAGQADLERAADLFERAAEAYEDALGALEDGVADRAEAGRIAARLREAAAAEREAGQIMLARGQ